MHEAITELEIKTISPKITSCYIENGKEYYVKVWFKWRKKEDGIIDIGGRHEFIGKDKSAILDEIRDHFTKDHGWYEII